VDSRLVLSKADRERKKGGGERIFVWEVQMGGDQNAKIRITR
jgi:hypothetical protein